MGVAAFDFAGTKSFNLDFPNSPAPGTYPLTTSGMFNFNFYVSGADTFFVSSTNPGTLKVLENNTTTKRLRANFSFTGYTKTTPPDSAKLTEGYFSIVY